MEELLQEGKIRGIGVSNFGQMDAFRAVAALHAVQSPYNLFERAIEADVLPYPPADLGARYGALCRGLLSGRMRSILTFPTVTSAQC